MTLARNKYEPLLVDLHREMKAGRGDGEHAKELRNAMTPHWHALSEDEQDLLDDLSEDLYLIEGKRHVVPLERGETADSVWRTLEATFRQGRPREALALTRKLTEVDAKVAYVIGRCWDQLKCHLGASCFFDHAYSLEPKPVYAISALESLARASLKRATARAEEIAARPVVEGSILLQAAAVLHRGAMLVNPAERGDVYARVIKMVDAAWTDATALASVRALGLIAAGYSHEHLGRHDEARLQFERAATIYPKEPALLAYGISLLSVNKRRALDQFTLAARQGSRFDWPYVYATQNALVQGRHAEAEQFAEAGLQRSNRPDIRGRLFEWSAIAAAHLGQSSALVVERFDRALAELPLDPTIHKNATAFIEATIRDLQIEELPAAPTLSELEQELRPAA